MFKTSKFYQFDYNITCIIILIKTTKKLYEVIYKYKNINKIKIEKMNW